SFAALSIPNLATRTVNDLPATEQHPSTSDRFRSIPTAGTTLTDLGVSIVFANPDMPNLQAKIQAILRDEHLPPGLSCRQCSTRRSAREIQNAGHSRFGPLRSLHTQ